MSMGTHPMPPSENATLISGNRVGMPAHNQSAAVTSAFTGKSDVYSSSGAPGERAAVQLDEPLWRHTTVSVSSQARRNGSQWVVCMDGSPRSTGFSGKLTALKPRSALARTSAAATSGSSSQASCRAMMRSGWGPAHSSLCQSFQARRQARPSSESLLRANTVPAKPAMRDGKHSDA